MRVVLSPISIRSYCGNISPFLSTHFSTAPFTHHARTGLMSILPEKQVFSTEKHVLVQEIVYFLLLFSFLNK